MQLQLLIQFIQGDKQEARIKFHICPGKAVLDSRPPSAQILDKFCHFSTFEPFPTSIFFPLLEVFSYCYLPQRHRAGVPEPTVPILLQQKSLKMRFDRSVSHSCCVAVRLPVHSLLVGEHVTTGSYETHVCFCMGLCFFYRIFQ